MDEFINRYSFLSDISKMHCTNCKRRKDANGKIVYEIGDAPCRACGIGDMLDAVEDYPAANARENVRGEWIHHDDDDMYGDYWECSNCHDEYCLIEGDMYYNFCPNCGEDMRGGTDAV